MDKPLFAAEYLLSVIKPLTKLPDLVRVDMETDENRGIMLEVTCDPADLPILVGRNGSRAEAFRVIMMGWGRLNAANVYVHVGGKFSIRE